MTDLTDLRNIGSQSARWLDSLGIHTAEDLYEVGVVEAYFQVKAAYPRQVSLNLLYALQGALLDLRWNELPPGMKADLCEQLGKVE